jgi:hypothetical protein
MELTEKERLMLVEQKKEIRKLTTEILGMSNDPKKAMLLKKRITAVLSVISTIASYSDSKNYQIEDLTVAANEIFGLMFAPTHVNEAIASVFWTNVESKIGLFCNYANSVRFDFTKRGVKIYLPKIDISLFRAK